MSRSALENAIETYIWAVGALVENVVNAKSSSQQQAHVLNSDAQIALHLKHPIHIKLAPYFGSESD
jgi:hypothetical protein